VDRYETLVGILLLLNTRGEARSAIRQALNLLKEIDDPRLSSLRYCLLPSESLPTIDDPFLGACDEYSIGNYGRAAHALKQKLEMAPADAWVYELAARNDIAQGIKSNDASLVGQIISEMGAFLALSRDLSDVRTALQKLGFQTRKLAPSVAIAALLDRVMDIPISEAVSDAQSVFCLSSPLAQPSNYGWLKRAHVTAFDKLKIDLADRESTAHQIGVISVAGDDRAGQSMEELGVPSKRTRLYLAYHYFNRAQYSLATTYYEEYRLDSSAATSPRTLTFQYALNYRQQRLEAALSAFVDAYFENNRSHSLYAMSEFAEWAVARASADKSAIDRSILLHVYSSYYDARHDGDLSDALEDVLDCHGV
jgi:hypothetical protein